MAESIYQGYVIKRQPYQVFDEIITFIIPNKKITCISLGSRKIESKNARNLFLGSYVEFEIFESRTQDKLSKLKKVHAIKTADWRYENLIQFNLLNECVDKTNKYDKQVFDFYKELLDLINKNEYSEEMQILAILKDFCLLSGLNFEVNHCVKCGSNKLKTISLTNHGMICNACFDSKTDRHYGLDVSKVFYYLFNNKLNELSKYIAELDFVIKLLKQYIDDNTGIKLNALNHY